ncbi:MAG: hypothetical protein SGILL_002847 [Bacillariaceae sp.]
MKYSLTATTLAALALAKSTRAFAPTSNHGAASTTTSLSATSTRRDILGAGLVSILGVSTLNVPLASAEPRPMYLTEPTDEFKANEAKAMEFKRQQLAVKKEFNTALEKFLAEANDSDALENDLKQLKSLVAKTGGLPLGVKKDELFKVIRSKKAKGFWPTPVEIAYQSLIQEISYQQSPNLDKDLGNPYQ